jgi:hypothetical protein
MPSIANITVKKNDGITDIVYTAVQPASGDGVYAIWKSQTVGSAQAHQPEFRFSARDADNGKKRATRTYFQYPQIATDTTTSVTNVLHRALVSTDLSFPKEMDQVAINEFVSQYANLLVATLVKDSNKAGYAPT